MKRERNPAFEPNHPQARQEIVPPRTPFRKFREAKAKCLDPLHISQRTRVTRTFGNEQIKSE